MTALALRSDRQPLRKSAGYRSRRLKRPSGPRWWIRVESQTLSREQAEEIKQAFRRARDVVVTNPGFEIRRLR